MSLRKDEQLLAMLMQMPTWEGRASMVRQLHPKAVSDLCEHLSKVVHQSKSHRLDNQEDRDKVSKALKPHSRVVKRITRIPGRSRGKPRIRVPNLRGQRGGAIISMILAAVVPLLAQMAISAITKK